MPLSSYRMHRIYLAATMNYGLGSDDSEELAYYKKIIKEMNDIKKDPIKKGITLNSVSCLVALLCINQTN